MTYVGEVGWELVVPVEDALAVYDALRDDGVRPTSGWATPATTRSSRSGSRRGTAPSRAT